MGWVYPKPTSQIRILFHSSIGSLHLFINDIYFPLES